MRIIRGLPDSLSVVDCALAIGNFDGVHLGHQALLQETVRAANLRGLVPAVLTFEPHPRDYFGRDTLDRISTLRDKFDRILACGIQRVYVIRFDKDFASLTPVEFARDILSRGLHCRWVTVGENFTFGKARSGNYDTLCELGRHYNFETQSTPLLFHGSARISSSRVRAAMALGDLFEVETILGRPYSVTGHVVHGAKLGRNLGFPTLNQYVIAPGSNARPALRGVFAVRIHGLDGTGTIYEGMASLGTKPTVTDKKRWLLETNVFDWSGDAYGRIVRIEFVAKIRDEKKFSSLQELTAAIEHDKEQAYAVFGRSITR
ncbi:MAG: bifunctional riboflavin kinase/FAD synthetase [Duodenibacillus sp.]|nr:bifunctional riboflavin kinase/FAD synthetase [Duodenibacillus sp.]